MNYNNVEAPQQRATAAREFAIRKPWINLWFDEAWEAAKSEAAAAKPALQSSGHADPADIEKYNTLRYSLAVEVEEIYDALVSLPQETQHLLQQSIQGPERAALVNATLASIPAGAAWLARKQARDAEADARNKAAQDAREAAWKAEQPAVIVAAIEANGTVLSLSRLKGILATGPDISADHIQLLREFRSGVEAILTARQAANMPRVIA